MRDRQTIDRDQETSASRRTGLPGRVQPGEHRESWSPDEWGHCWTEVAAGLMSSPRPGGESWLTRLPTFGTPLPADSKGVRYVVSAVDDRGRCADRSLPRLMSWEPVHRFELYAAQGLLMLVRRPEGIALITNHGYVRLPPFVRRGLGLAPGDRILLAACRHGDRLLGFTMQALAAMTLTYCSSLVSEEN